MNFSIVLQAEDSVQGPQCWFEEELWRSCLVGERSSFSGIEVVRVSNVTQTKGMNHSNIIEWLLCSKNNGILLATL